jgi:ferredoxin
MTKYKLIHTDEDCIGCAACTAVTPDNWKMVEIEGEDKARPINPVVDESKLEENKEAAESCPTEAIHIEEEESGKKIF